MKKAYFALLFLVAAFARAEAQDVKVCVTDNWNRPLSEVAITIADDRTVAARTDVRGEAVIQAPEGSRITLTLFNRKSKTVRVEGSLLSILGMAEASRKRRAPRHWLPPHPKRSRHQGTPP